MTDLEFEQRPWGAWYIIDEGPGYKVKRIHVNPGCRLSYQFHDHRSEHWVVVDGVATATIDGDTAVAVAGQSVDVPRGSAHRLANEGDQELIVIEVQRGAYTGEDDITRLEDDYGRCHGAGVVPVEADAG